MSATRVLPMAFAGFVALGLPEGAVGVAWPSMASDLDRAVAELGLLILAYVGGYFVASLLNGVISSSFGTGNALVTSSLAAAVGLAGYAATRSWLLLLASAVVLGTAGGLIDAGVNAHVAVHHGTRVMGWLHAFFGIGATLGPLVMTLLLEAGFSWRSGFAVLAAAQVILAAGFYRTRRRWATPGAPDPQTGGRVGWTLIPGLGGFFLVTGLEAGTGQWAFSLLTLARDVDSGTAGLLVTAYWASFTLGRVLMGTVGHRISQRLLLSIGVAATTAGIGLLWWNPAAWVGAVGLLATGIGLSPVFPVLVLLTPARVGPDRTSAAVGYQLAAATAGGAVIPAGLGAMVDWFGLEVVPPVLFAAAVLLILTTPARHAGR